MVLFTLGACNNETYQDTDKMSAENNSSSQNSIKTVDSNTGYEPPFEETISQAILNYSLIIK